ncbi:MAG: S8 family serine peptidase [Candidatus Thermoplasmatota archaeon]|nr:S8 family serine peptidase [Candidatus Thermoplasmatota archaeon]
MSGRWLAVALVVLLLPLGPAYAASTSETDLSQEEDTGLGPVHVVAGSTLTSTLGPVPTVLDFGGQSFDPVDLSPRALGPDGLAVVQFFHGDGHVQLAALEGVEATVLDHVDRATMVVRLAPGAASVLAEDPSVRWVGAYDVAWRMDARLADGAVERYALVVADDVHPDLLPRLVVDLLEAGADEATCGVGQCIVSLAAVEPSARPTFVEDLARDGRFLWIEPAYAMEVHNAVAAGLAGVIDVRNNASFTLDGSGETIAITDTGLDRDHPDIVGRIAVIDTSFGLDPSPADSNAGHGTHVALTVLGDGTGDASTTGMAPAASLVMYPLEHDPTGVFGRQGSLYEMLSDADQATARVSVNAWGLNGGHGDYTSDSRSVDQYVDTFGDLLPVFSASDAGTTGVTPPATAKNALGVGASNGTTLLPWSDSGQGPLADGRIKPDVIAPGMAVCSGRAEEARFPAGSSCGTGTHANGDPLYMSLSGTSQATAVAGGTAALVREYIREEAGLTAPSAALIKAMLINGAKDVGAADIPNGAEGWGHIDLDRTVRPMDGSTMLTTFLDDGPSLRAGYGLLYSFDLDPSSGIDITLAWSDTPGSAASGTTSTRLINDLDLVLVAPDGTRWLGNDFANGFSSSGGAADDVNNVERIRVSPGVLTGTGAWTVEVHHRGGQAQDFALVVVADASATPTADLVGLERSILLSTDQPLKDDVISISMSWLNQGTAQAPAHRVVLTDLTEGAVLYDDLRSPLGSGSIDSHIILHTFSTTGTHTLELKLDTDDEVTELNDAQQGVDNNVFTLDVEVSALGVRVIPYADDGSLPTTSQEREAASNHDFDVRNSSEIEIPIRVQHEGTGNRTVAVTVTQVQAIDAALPGVLLSPKDAWSKGLNETGPYAVKEFGETGDHRDLTLILTDLDAVIGGTGPDRYAASGTYVVDVKASYTDQPFVSHTQRFTVNVGRVDDVLVGVSGTLLPNGDPIAAEPGSSVSFSIAVMNTGNSPARYNLACTVDLDGWQVGLDGTAASTLDFEPLDILQDLPMPVSVSVPPIVDGSPTPDEKAQVVCTVTSATDPDFSHVEILEVGVLPQAMFSVDVSVEGERLGPSALAEDVKVDSAELVELDALVSNLGNVPVDLTMTMQLGDPKWAYDAEIDGVSVEQKASIPLTLQPGSSEIVTYLLLVPPTAEQGDANTYQLKTRESAQFFISNTTRLVVAEELEYVLTLPENASVSVNGDFTFLDVDIENTGTTLMSLAWATGLVPDGWSVAFSNPPEFIAPREVKTARLGIMAPPGTGASSNALEVLIDVSANSGSQWLNVSERLDVAVSETMHATLDAGVEGALLDLVRSTAVEQQIAVVNTGNLPLAVTCDARVENSDRDPLEGWEVSCSGDLGALAVDADGTVTVTFTPTEDAPSARSILVVELLDAEGAVIGFTSVEVAPAPAGNNGGLFGVLPGWAAGLVLAGVLLVLIVVGLRVRGSAVVPDMGEDILAPGAHAQADTDGQRRADLLDTGAEHDLTSGAVSEEEIQAALAQSIEPLPTPAPGPVMPAGRPPMAAVPKGLPPLGAPLPAGRPPAAKPLPPLPAPAVAPPLPALPPAQPAVPPVPAEGLPEGWTMEQWQHYGQQWLVKNGRA